MKALVTGGMGFFGGHLASALCEKGYQVDLLDDCSRGAQDFFILDLMKKFNLKIIRADLRDQSVIERISSDYSYVFHLAAIIGVKHVLKNPYEVLVSNVEMTKNAISIARKQKELHRLFFSSTSEVYAGSLIHLDMQIPTPEDTPIALTSLTDPRTAYMLSKLYGETMCNLSDLPFTNLRLHNIYGPRMGMSHVIPELLYKAWSSKNDESLEVSSMSHTRTFCFISDAIAMILGLIASEIAIGKTINIGNQAPEVSIRYLASRIVETVGRRLIIKETPSTPGSPLRRCPNTNVLQSIISSTSNVSLEKGIQLTFDWYRQHVYESADRVVI